jgi:Tfp pilus assembly protein PilF
MQHDFITECRRAIAAGHWDKAAAACQRALQADPRVAQAHFLAGLIAGHHGEMATAVRAFRTALELDPGHGAAGAQLARCLVSVGQFAEAEAIADGLPVESLKDPAILDVLATAYSHIGKQDKALPLFRRAVAAQPDSPRFQSNLAACLIFLGFRPEAAQALRTAMQRAQGVDLARCHWQLSTLASATDHRHIEEISALAAATPDSPALQSFLHYALGKEHEDLEEWPQAWRHFVMGADAAARVHRYSAEADEALFGAIISNFNRQWLRQQASGVDDASRIFIVGLPRTGTTLLERILSAHSRIGSAGELQQFPLAVKRLSRVRGPVQLTPGVVEAATTIDMSELGAQYLDSSRFIAAEPGLVIDKLPHNFLYLGLIAAALPGAHIIHLRRHPLDTCFAMYKQLFAAAYTFSYKLPDLGRYYLLYHQLMQHWRELLGDRLIEVDYEDLVYRQEETTGRVLARLGLPMEADCLDFHTNPAAVATASASQVREPVHSRSVGRWRHYAEQLSPLREQLAAGGVLLQEETS